MVARYQWVLGVWLLFLVVSGAFLYSPPRVLQSTRRTKTWMASHLPGLDVTVDPYDNLEKVINNFNKSLKRSGLLRNLRNKIYHENSVEKKKRKEKQSRMKKKYYRIAKQRTLNSMGMGDYPLDFDLR
jgi:ribosomal protein S21